MPSASHRRARVDTGAIYGVVPADVLRGLCIAPLEHETFGATPLLGALTLESMGLMVNPVTREVLPMRRFLAGLPPASYGTIA